METSHADNLEPFLDAARHPVEYARQWKKKNKRNVIGYFCSYAPEEIIFAADALPFRIFNTGKPTGQADVHLQAYSCSLVRGALDDALNGELDFLKGTVFPHTCDSIQRLSDIWRMNMKFDFHLDVVLPVLLRSDSARDYMLDVIRKFKLDLEVLLERKISKEQLRKASDVYNDIRKLLAKLHGIRINHPGLMSATDFYAVVKSGMIMDRLDFSRALSTLVSDLDRKKDMKPVTGKRVVLAGGFCNMPEIFNTIEMAGGTVISDDFCTGTRNFQGLINTKDDILEGIADRYLSRINCPAKHNGLYSRGEYIVALAKESLADGVIFLHLKFCDPHAFDYPYIKNMLDREGIPSMLMEIEDQMPSEGQFRTRCEAFLEML